MTIAAPLSDNRNDSTSAQFDYYVGNRGQCGTDIAPSVGQLLSCLYTTGDDGTQTKGPAPAFQVDGNGNCKRLGDSAANGVFDVTFSNNNIGRTVRRPLRRPRARAPHPALTPIRPPPIRPPPQNRLYSAGVRMSYTNGDVCFAANGTKLQRALTVYFECYDSPLVITADQVYEDEACVYRAVIRTRFGCPLQCTGGAGSGGSRPCGGHGVCGYDATNSRARCFCNRGYGGATCVDSAPEQFPAAVNYGGNIAGAFFGGIVAGLAGVAAWLVFQAVRAGGTWRDALDLSKAFAPSAGGGAYTPAPSAAPPAFTGASFAAPADSGYVAPAADGML
jgi:hypothetical protein